MSAISKYKGGSVLLICIAASLFLHVGGVGSYVIYRLVWPNEEPEEIAELNKPEEEYEEYNLPEYKEEIEEPSPKDRSHEDHIEEPHIADNNPPEPEEQPEEQPEPAANQEEDVKVEVIPDEAKEELVEEEDKLEEEAPVEKAFARTSDDQLEGVNEDAQLEGDRDTIAASDTEPDPDAPLRPASSGEEDAKNKELFNSDYQDGEIEPAQKKVNEQVAAASPPSPPAPQAPPSGAPPIPPVEEPNDLKEPSKEDQEDQEKQAEEELLAKSDDSKDIQPESAEPAKNIDDLGQEDFKDGEDTVNSEAITAIDTPDVYDRSETIVHGEAILLPEERRSGVREKIALPNPQEGVEEAPQNEHSAENPGDVESENLNSDDQSEEEPKVKDQQGEGLKNQKLTEEEQIEELKKKKEEARVRRLKIAQTDPFARANPNIPVEKSGFKEHARKQKLSGSLSRRAAVASQDVKSTPLGKYHVKVLKAVEKEWQALCRVNADFILPGTLNVSFSVSPTGAVENISFIDSVAGGPGNKGITLRSIQKAKIPAMPAELKKVLGGASHEVRINFNFH